MCLSGCAYSFTYVNGKRISECDSSEILEKAWESYNKKDYEEAAHLAAYIPQHHPDCFDAEEAYYLAGDSCFQNEDYWLSFRYYRDLLTRFPVSQYIDDVAQKDFQIGEAYLNQEPGFFGHLFTNRSRGVTVMNHLVTNFSRHALADDALMAMGDYFFEDKEYPDAAFNYTQLIKLYRGSEWVEKALFRLGESYFLDSKGVSYDRDPPLKAWICMGSYINRYPKGNYVDPAQELLLASREQLAQKELEIANYYINQDCDLGTRIHLSNILLKFPEAKAGLKAREIMVEHNWDTSLHSVDKMVPTESMRFLQ
ncbi:MAG: outer membrane protein assembly factor BamD [Planctomycetota bacterium]